MYWLLGYYLYQIHYYIDLPEPSSEATHVLLSARLKDHLNSDSIPIMLNVEPNGSQSPKSLSILNILL